MSYLRSCLAFVALAVSLTCLPAAAGTGRCLHIESFETIADIERAILGEIDAANQEARDNVPGEIRSQVSRQATTVFAPMGFSDQVNRSIYDFLPYLQGVVNGVSTSKDKKSVTVQWNPFRVGKWGTMAITSTLTEPEPSKRLLNAVVEGARPAQEDALEEQIRDYDDVTLAFKYGYHRKSEGRRRMLLGRAPELYLAPIGRLTGALAPAIPEDAQLQYSEWTLSLVDRIKVALGVSEGDGFDVREVPISSIKELTEARALEPGFLCSLHDAIRYDAMRQFDRLEDLAGATEVLASMVNNQAQAVVTGSFRFRDDLVGQDTVYINASFEYGIGNLNALLRRADYGRAGERLKEVFEEMDGEKRTNNQHKFTFSGAYSKNRGLDLDYDYLEVVTDPATSDQITIPRVASISVPESWEWSAQIQYSRYIRRETKKEGANNKDPLFVFSIEYSDVNDDPERQDRGQARLSLTVPITESISIPLTVGYATRSELLGEFEHRLGAHFGLNYKFARKD